MEIRSGKILWDSNPRPTNPSFSASVSSFLMGTSWPTLVEAQLGSHWPLGWTVCLERSPAFKFWNEPELPRACTSERVGHQLLRYIPALPSPATLTIPMTFPGLTKSAVDRERKPAKIAEVTTAELEKYEQNLKEIRSLAGTRRGLARKQTPLERGWTGSNPQGRKFGKPVTPNTELTFDGFESILIEYRWDS